MTTQELIEKQELGLEILEAIQCYEGRIEEKKSSWYRNVNSHFPALKEQAEHDIDIYERCIVRLKERYLKQMDIAFKEITYRS